MGSNSAVSEWWTYDLADFMLFSERVYRRLFEAQNEAWWPLQVFFLSFGVLFALSLFRSTQVALGFRKFGWVGLCLAWLFVAVTFLTQRYAPISPVAQYGAWAFTLQAVLLGALTIREPQGVRTPGARSLVGFLLVMAGTVVYPAWGIWRDAAFANAEWFGLMPDPTALATVGFVLLAGRTWLVSGLLLFVPVTWITSSALTIQAMMQRDLAA